MKKLLIAALPAFFCGCFLNTAMKAPHADGVTVAAELTREPDFSLGQDIAVGRSFFAWSSVSASSVSSVSLLSVNNLGGMLWRVSPAPENSARQLESRIAVSSSCLYAVWAESAGGGFTLNAAVYDNYGKPLLAKTRISGIYRLIADSVMIVATKENSAYVIWQDFDPRIKTPFVRLAKLGTGGVVWLKTLGDREMNERYLTPVIADAGDNGVLAAFRYIHNGDKGIVARRFNSDGTTWADDVRVSDVMGYKSAPQIVRDGAGGAYIAWEDGRDGDLHVYAQHISSAGAVLWDTAGIPVEAAEGNQWNTVMIYDGAGGFFCGWIDDNDGAKWTLKVQHVDNSGHIIWGQDGTTVCDSDNNQSLPSMVDDGAGGTIVVWNEDRHGHAGIFAQRFTWRGEALWLQHGVPVIDSSHDEVDPQVVSAGGGGCLVAWKHRISARTWELKAQRLNAAGTPVWR
jgi:hypothetical protein